MKMRVGVTGGTGFIGYYLLKDYANRYHFVVATSQTAPPKPVANVEYRKTDYSEGSLKNIFSDCDAVVHLGSHVMQGLDKEIQVQPYVSNLVLADNIFRICHELGIKNIINASSVAVYQHMDDVPTKETDPCFPNSVYGVIKIAIEKLAALYNKKYGLMIKNLRLAQGLGKPKDMQSGRFWSVVLRNCLEGKAIPIWGSGTNGRDLIYVRDMALGIVKALEHPEIKGDFNIGTGVLTTNLDVANAYCEVFHNTAGIIFVPMENEPIDRAWMDCSKAEKYLGFVPQYDLLSMVQDIKQEMELDSKRQTTCLP